MHRRALAIDHSKAQGGGRVLDSHMRGLQPDMAIPWPAAVRRAPDLPRVQGVSLGLLTVRRRLRDKPLEDLHLILQAVFNVFQPGRRGGISDVEE